MEQDIVQHREMLPETGFVRLQAIIAPARAYAHQQIDLVARASRTARFPKPVKLGPKTTAWRVEDIRELINRFGRIVVANRRHTARRLKRLRTYNVSELARVTDAHPTTVRGWARRVSRQCLASTLQSFVAWTRSRS